MSSFLNNVIRKNKHSFSKTENTLAKFFLSNEKKIVNMTIAQISEKTDISQTSIFNFVKTLGFTGFQDFKISIASNNTYKTKDRHITVYSDIKPDDSAIEIADKVISFNELSLKTLKESLTQENITKIIDIVNHSETLHFYGQGGSSAVAFDSYHKFTRTTFNTQYSFDYHIQLSEASKLGKDDCVFLFSHTGETVETINLARVISQTPAKLIVLTGNPISSLLELSDANLIIYTEEVKVKTETLISRILFLTIMDIIYTVIVYQDEDRHQEVVNNIRKALKLSKDE